MISLQISFEKTWFWNDRVESFGKMQGFSKTVHTTLPFRLCLVTLLCWGQGSYNTSSECWEVEGPSLWRDSGRSVRVSGLAVNESQKFTLSQKALGPTLAASTFRRMPLKEESNLWRKLSSFRWCLKARLFYLDFQSNVPVNTSGVQTGMHQHALLTEAYLRCLRTSDGSCSKKASFHYLLQLFPAWNNGFQKIEAHDEHHLQPQFRQPDPK